MDRFMGRAPRLLYFPLSVYVIRIRASWPEQANFKVEAHHETCQYNANDKWRNISISLFYHQEKHFPLGRRVWTPGYVSLWESRHRVERRHPDPLCRGRIL